MCQHKCNNCHEIFNNDDMKCVSAGFETYECWGTLQREEIFNYYCPHCGSEDFETLEELPELEPIDNTELDKHIDMIGECVEAMKEAKRG